MGSAGHFTEARIRLGQNTMPFHERRVEIVHDLWWNDTASLCAGLTPTWSAHLAQTGFLMNKSARLSR